MLRFGDIMEKFELDGGVRHFYLTAVGEEYKIKSRIIKE